MRDADALGEFDLIRRYFTPAASSPTVKVGVGDDAAVVALPPAMQLAVTTDTLVAGVHFPNCTDPYSIGHKALAVNLSDLAAMGATPAWFTLNLSLPAVDSSWLQDFSAGLFALARQYSIDLIGGDTTRGPLSITITAHGFVPAAGALLRTGARVGDRIYVSGTLGDAGIALRMLEKKLVLAADFQPQVFAKLNRPTPRVAEGLQLRGLASACIDLSDGLLADLGHILARSGVGARVDVRRLPVSKAYDSVFGDIGGWDLALAHGDDYELCFTVPAAKQMAFNRIVPQFQCGFAHIGDIEAEAGLRLITDQGRSYVAASQGFDHFA